MELPDSVAFIGLGRMGQPMTRRLAAGGVTVRGHDPAEEPRKALAGVVTHFDSPAEAAEGVSVVILMLPDSNVVESVVNGGLLDALRPGARIVDMSSSEPTRTTALAEKAAERGVTLVDAPVSGGVPGAKDGTMAIMVGGPSEVASELIPLLSLMGRPRHVGPVGAGHALKALNNLMSASHLLASSEALLVGERFGLDPAVMLDVINGSSGRSASTQVKWPNYVLPETYNSGFTIGLMVKDLRIALGLAEATEGPATLATHTVELWTQAARKLGQGADHTEIVRWLRGLDHGRTDSENQEGAR